MSDNLQPGQREGEALEAVLSEIVRSAEPRRCAPSVRSREKAPELPLTVSSPAEALTFPHPEPGTSAVKGIAHSRDIRSPGTATSRDPFSAAFASRCASTARRHWRQPER